ncbi:MAG: hypothetical protein ACK5LO_09105 [Leucobacter sp.]
MKHQQNRLVIATAAAVLALPLMLTLSSCAGQAGEKEPASTPTSEATTTDKPIGGDVIAPVTEGVNDLQGTTVELVVGQVLNIDTESLAVDSYTAEIADPAVVSFTQGRDDGSAEFNPGLEALAAGTTEVTLTNEQGGIQPLTFTVKVAERE